MLHCDYTSGNTATGSHCESLREFLAFVKCEKGDKTQHGPLSLRPGQVIEIQGTSGSGKTQLVCRLVLNCVLSMPPKVAVVFDTSGTFDAKRLKDLLCDKEEKYLERVLVFRPESTVHLCATLDHLPVLLARRYNATELGLVVVDSISDFYWQDKFVDELHASLLGPKRQPTINNVFIALEELRRAFAPSIILTNWGLVKTPQGSSSGTHQQYFKSHLDPGSRYQTAPTGSTGVLKNLRLPLHYHLSLTHDVDSRFKGHVWSPKEVENDHRFDFELEVTEREVVIHPFAQQNKQDTTS